MNQVVRATFLLGLVAATVSLSGCAAQCVYEVKRLEHGCGLVGTREGEAAKPRWCCYHKNESRPISTLSDCPGAASEYDAGLCYRPCKDGYSGRGPICYQNCPAGFRDDGVRNSVIVITDSGHRD